ncbi:MAG: imidazole glycerol phosphate synthase subunit HisH [Clostridia bacterium]|nr:imidazole glycerol phosphate synthase subunit HisH [Clostridia bacterium]
MITIVDYGVGNLFSLESSFKAIGEDVRVSGDADEIFKADKLILPGVGAFGDAAEKLAINGLKEAVLAAVAKGTPLMGICLGMQLLLEKGYEYGEHDGLGLIKGSVRPIADVIDPALKIPQIGWNALIFTKPSKLFKYIRQGDHVYFVHSFHAADCEESVTSKTEYSALLTASVERDNVYGCQFHPEKSGKVGLNILRAFCEEG